MVYKDLDDNQRRRFNRSNVCPICHQKIKDDEDFIIIKTRIRRCKQYTFYHKGCLCNENKQEIS